MFQVVADINESSKRGSSYISHKIPTRKTPADIECKSFEELL